MEQYNRDIASHRHALLVFVFVSNLHVASNGPRILILLYPLPRVFNLLRKMKSLKGAFALGLLPTTAIAQSVMTIRLPTCIPGGGTGIPGIDTGATSGPAPTGPTTEVINVTATNSLGSVTVEPITQVVTPGASAT